MRAVAFPTLNPVPEERESACVGERERVWEIVRERARAREREKEKVCVQDRWREREIER